MCFLVLSAGPAWAQDPTPPPFRAEALRLASRNRSTLAAARTLNIDAKLIYEWHLVGLRRPGPVPVLNLKEVVVS